MGLLEKALKFKKEINLKGEETIIDRIKGPAESELIEGPEKVSYIASKNQALASDESGEAEEFFESYEEEIPESGPGILRLDNRDLVSIEKISRETIERSGNKIKFIAADEYPEDTHPDYIQEETSDKAVESFSSETADSGIVEESVKERGPGKSPEKEGLTRTAAVPGNYEYLTDDNIAVLYEISREFHKAENETELFDILLFTIMGLMGVASSVVIKKDPDKSGKWLIADSRGIAAETNIRYIDRRSVIWSEMLDKKEPVDIESYRTRPGVFEEYEKYLIADARVLIPLVADDEVQGAYAIGNKITGDNYSPEDIIFLKAVGDLFAAALRALSRRDQLIAENSSLKEEVGNFKSNEEIYKKISFSRSSGELKDTLAAELESFGIKCFFVYGRKDGPDLEMLWKHNSDLPGITMRESLSRDDEFVRRMLRERDCVEIAKPDNSAMVSHIVGPDQAGRVKHFAAVPFFAGEDLQGLLVVLQAAEVFEKKATLKKVFLTMEHYFLYLNLIAKSEISGAKFFDFHGILSRNIHEAVANAARVNIPVTVLQFSVRNLKRIHDIAGYGKAEELMDDLKKIVLARISDHDFIMRTDKNRYVAVLPGKDRKYAAVLANVVTGELAHTHSAGKQQPLVTYLCSEYPSDSESADAMIDFID